MPGEREQAGPATGGGCCEPPGQGGNPGPLGDVKLQGSCQLSAVGSVMGPRAHPPGPGCVTSGSLLNPSGPQGPNSAQWEEVPLGMAAGTWGGPGGGNVRHTEASTCCSGDLFSFWTPRCFYVPERDQSKPGCQGNPSSPFGPRWPGLSLSGAPGPRWPSGTLPSSPADSGVLSSACLGWRPWVCRHQPPRVAAQLT